MDTGVIVHTESFSTEAGVEFPAPLIHRLEQFTRQHYLIQDVTEFNNTILGVKKPGDLAIFYGHNHRMMGFMRLYRQSFQVNSKEYIVFIGGTFQDQRQSVCYHAAKIGLIQAMKYQLGHPDQDLVFFSSVNTPTKYQFLSTMSDVFYPRPNTQIPGHVLKLVKKLKEYNHWQSAAEHPMVIKNQLAVLYPDMQASEPNELTEYYQTINPDYHAGHALLVYLPLNLATIGHGIRQVVTHATHVVSADTG